LEQLIIYTDGACINNPGSGASGAIIIDNALKIVKIESDFYQETTNNQMELLGPISGLESIISDNSFSNKSIKIYTDSKYVKNGITDWILKWKKNGWKASDGKPVKNQDLWKRLDDLNEKLRPEWEWIKGHNNNFFNEVVDFIATTAAKSSTKFDLILHKDQLLKKFPSLNIFHLA
jgi:ribonuclease HI